MKSNAPISARPDPGPREPRWFGWVTAGALGTLAAATVTYVVYGLPNADEGWYLYAARLVYQGQLPYRDFAYLQTPLQPLLFAPLQWLFAGHLFIAMRLANALLALVTIALVYATGRRAGANERAALAASTMLVACESFLTRTSSSPVSSPRRDRRRKSSERGSTGRSNSSPRENKSTN